MLQTTPNNISSVEELIDVVRSYNPGCDAIMLREAFSYSKKAHAHQVRKSGEAYFTHPFAVAQILTEYRGDDATIASALLHDTVEDTETTLEDIDRLFGQEICIIVDGLTKMKQLDFTSRKAVQGENFRKLLLAVSKDVRVLLVKIADRLHNMRTIGFMRSDKRTRIAQETIDIYAPLAGRMGMHQVREELEDMSFRALNPEAHSMILQKLNSFGIQSKDLMEKVLHEFQSNLSEAGMDVKITARQKRPFSIWRKMERKSVSFEHLSDVIGMRVIVPEEIDCYRALGIAHTTWKNVPDRFKDYISSPKQNDYRSLHTTVFVQNNQKVEFQIRTKQMNALAEYGIAAHALYKDNPNSNDESESFITRLQRESRAYKSLQNIIESRIDGDHPEELLENTRLELFTDQVFCFTPKGKLIAMPTGATPIDFAFAVHTQVGIKCVGCYVNGRSVPLNTNLMNGDEIEILTSTSARPSASWEHIAITGKARAAIRKETRLHNLKEYSDLGRQIANRFFARHEKRFDDNLFKTTLNRLAYPNIEEAYAALGQGHLGNETIMHALYPNFQLQSVERTRAMTPKQELDKNWFGLSRAHNFKFLLPAHSAELTISDATPENIGQESKHIVRSVIGEGTPVGLKKGSGIVPGDRVVGIITEDEGITIYSIESPELSRYEDDMSRWLDVRWDLDDENPERYMSYIQISIVNEPGSLAEITQMISEADANIDNIDFKTRERDYSTLIIDLEVWDATHINTLIRRIREVPVVYSIKRVIW